MRYNNRKKKRYINLKKGIIDEGEKSSNNNNDNGLTAEDLGIELESTGVVGSLEELSEEERKIIEDAKIKEYEEKLLAEMQEKKKDKEDYSAFEKIIAKIKKEDLSSSNTQPKASVVELDEELLKKYGYPKKVIDPTDIELDEDGKPQYFFNIKKTLKKNNMEWLMNVIGEERLIKMTYDDDFFDKYADKQHRRAFNYNNMSPTEQYLHDRKKRIKKYGVSGIFVLIILSSILFNKIPEYKYKDAKSLYDAAKYEESYEAYGKIKGDTAEYYKTLSFIKMSIENSNFDDAIRASEYIIEKGLDKNQEESGEAILSNVIYQQGLEFFRVKEFEKAYKSFEEILGYKDAENYYNKSLYEIAEKHFENGETKEALKGLYRVLDHEDASDRFDKIAGSEYNKALNLYNKKNYKEAKELFAILAEFKYKDSADMVVQCNYKRGLDLFVDGKYDEAIKELSLNKGFKDSGTIVNESIYRKANDLLLISPAKANIELSQIRGYRDVENLLQLPLLNLYGEWDIVKADGNNVEKETFVFSVNRKVLANKPIKNMRISSPGDEISYNWQSDKFVSEDELSSIKVIKVSSDEITIVATNQGSSTTYNCVRKNTLYDYMGLNKKNDNKKDDKVNFGDENDLIQNILNKYVN